jgi:hypothetical protein
VKEIYEAINSVASTDNFNNGIEKYDDFITKSDKPSDEEDVQNPEQPEEPEEGDDNSLPITIAMDGNGQYYAVVATCSEKSKVLFKF